MARSGQMTALLGLLAIAGFQNRDKIKEMLSGLGQNPQQGHPAGSQRSDGQQGDMLGNLAGSPGASRSTTSGGLGGLGDLISGGTAGSVLSGGLGDLIKSFQEHGYGEKAKTWVEQGANEAIDDKQLAEALGPEVLDDLSARTGFSRDELLARLSRELPKAVDGLTPEGRLPSVDI